MRIDWLRLTFGCFDAHTVDLAADGVHIVVGPNEAGKSTLRHAFGQFLYGIDARTTYDFAVPNKSDLWIRAGLRAADGSRLAAVRLKKTKDDLLVLQGGDGSGAAGSGGVPASAAGLLTPGAPVPPEVFAGLLGGVAKDEFGDNFAIDHDELTAGGAALFAGKGDVARALFEAQSGARLGAVLNRLNADIDELYKRTGSVPRLNRSMKRYTEAAAEVRGATLNVRDYEQLRAAVERTEKERERISEELGRERAELSRLTRVQQALPALAAHTQLTADRAAALAAGPLVPADTAARLATLRATRQTAAESLTRAELHAARLTEQLAAARPDRSLLAHADTIDELHRQSAAVAEAAHRAETARTAAAGLRAEISALSAESGLTLAALPDTLSSEIEDLRRTKTELDADTRTAAAAHARRQTAHSAAARALTDLPAALSPTPVKALLKSIPASLPDRLAALAADLTAEQVKSARLQSRHGLSESSPQRPFPTAEQVTTHRNALDLAEAALGNARLWLRDAEDALDVHRRDLQVLLRQDAPPTEEELREARRVRDALLAALRTGDGDLAEPPAAGATAVPAPPGPTPAGHETPAEPAGLAALATALTAADDIVDRIRREADRSARRQRLEIDIEAGVLDLERKRVELADRDAASAAVRAAWADLWLPTGLAAPEPAAALPLLDAVAKLREHADTADRLQADLDAAQAQAAQAVERLRAALPAAPAEAGLAELLALAEEEHEVREAARRKREKAEEKVAAAAEELAAAEADVAACADRAEVWAGAWARTLAAHALTGDPDDVLAALTTAAEIARLTEEAAEAEAEADEAEARVRAHDDAIAAVLAALAAAEPDDETPGRLTDPVPALPTAADPVIALFDLAEADVEADVEATDPDAADPETAADAADAAATDSAATDSAVDDATPLIGTSATTAQARLTTLHRRLDEHRDLATIHAELTRQLATTRADHAEAALAAETAERGVADLLAGLGLADLPALDAAVARTAAVADLDARLAVVAATLDGTGRSLAALQAEADEWAADPDRLDAAVAAAAFRVAEREGEHTEQVRILAEQRKDLRAMDGSAKAAQASERAAEELATVVEESEEYLRLFLARKILLECMEEYREANQGPVLARAEAVFRALTAGRFDRLVADADDKGRFQLLARRASGEQVGVEAMSEGTRDQLYLALRLASLDRYADAGRAMPLLLDDVFMTFDDGRSRAGLAVLDGLADRFQIVLFTHHPHLAALAAADLPAGRVHVHELPARGLPPAGQPAVPAQHGAVSTPTPATTA